MPRLLLMVLALTLSACSAPAENTRNQPKPLHLDKPNYPVYAYRNRIEGKVVFDFDVNAQGRVTEMRIRESVPDHLFDDVVTEAVSKWRYEPGKPANNLHMTIKMNINPPE